MATLSLAMIVKNAESTIEKCLQSVGNLADEIIIVDTGSTDNTKNIVKNFTNNIYDFEWIDNFSAARNFSFSKCTKDYILWLDADDFIRPTDYMKLKELKNANFYDKDIIICKYIYNYDENYNSNLTVCRERIIKRSLDLKWEGEIHEYLPLHGSIYNTDINIYHRKQGSTSDRNIKILEKAISKKKTSRNLYYLAKEYLDIENYDNAIKYFNEFLKCNDTYWEDVCYAHFYIAMSYYQKYVLTNDLTEKNNFSKKFHEFIFKSLEIEDRIAEPYYLLGLFYMNQKQYERAIWYYELCTKIKRPDSLLSAFEPKYYTWLPCLNLAFCYYYLNDLEQAYKYNEKVLEYHPNDERALFNKKLMLELKYKNGNNKKLNIGCGSKRLDGYVNCDIFKSPTVDEIFDLSEVPYKDNTIQAIYSEHALEHVTYTEAEKALKEWYRVLVPGGELLLKIPDFEACCKSYLLSSEDYLKKWYKHTIYGIQRSLSGEPDEAQIHKWGYSKKEITSLLESIGFIVQYVKEYDGYDTPSLEIKALKRKSDIKVAWISPYNLNAAQTRLRVINVSNWLKKQGYYSDIIEDFTKANSYDIIIVGKEFSNYVLENIKALKKQGKIIYCDICEDILEYPYVKEIITECDKVICCSRILSEKVSKFNLNNIVIEEAWE